MATTDNQGAVWTPASQLCFAFRGADDYVLCAKGSERTRTYPKQLMPQTFTSPADQLDNFAYFSSFVGTA